MTTSKALVTTSVALVTSSNKKLLAFADLADRLPSNACHLTLRRLVAFPGAPSALAATERASILETRRSALVAWRIR